MPVAHQLQESVDLLKRYINRFSDPEATEDRKETARKIAKIVRHMLSCLDKAGYARVWGSCPRCHFKREDPFKKEPEEPICP